MDDLELALDDCLQQLAAGTSSLGQCLARYPKYAKELRPLLETALRLQQGKELRPSGALRDRARAELLSHMKSHPRRRKPRGIPKLAAGILSLALALGVVGTAVAQTALPGQTLYGLKLSTERAWRAASGNPVSADLTLADRRTRELITLASDGDSERSSAESQGIAAYTDVLNRLATEADGPSGEEIMTALQVHQTALLSAGIHVPELERILLHAESKKGQPPHDPGQGGGKGQGGQGQGQGNGHKP